jgi:hypothetical protein
MHMTVGKTVAIVVLAIIGGAIAGLVSKSIFVGVGFPILLIGFYAIEKSLKKMTKEVPTQEPQQASEENNNSGTSQQ